MDIGVDLPFTAQDLALSRKICTDFKLTNAEPAIASFIDEIRCDLWPRDFIDNPEKIGGVPVNGADLRQLYGSLKETAERILKLTNGLVDPAAVSAHFCPPYYAAGTHIMKGIIALGGGHVRKESVSRVEAILPQLIARVAQIWLEFSGEGVDGPFSAVEAGCEPMPDTGAAFVVAVIEAADWPFTAQQIWENLAAARRLEPWLFAIEDDDEATGD